uniref:Uncharacterized protein n=1 Tax=Anguilla anguilla TaxID=7936 RepID=A0A0E9R978_ANGAN
MILNMITAERAQTERLKPWNTCEGETKTALQRVRARRGIF